MEILIVSVVIVLAMVQGVSAEENPLIGLWFGMGTASEAIYGEMRITAKEISWGGTNPYNPFCKTTYKLVRKYTADRDPDNMFPLEPGRTFTIYELRLGPERCAKRQRVVLFGLPSDKDGYAEMVSYGDDGQLSGWNGFSKAVDAGKANKK